jgi:anthranilate synthase/aminodeoxychorismate synthase-like glutamine amidotransferase
MRVLLLDNYDSFTWNLAHYLTIAGLNVTIKRNDDADLPQNIAPEYDALVLSPGPGTPAQAGRLLEVLSFNINKLPVLGICLGHQAIGEFFGWQLCKAKVPVHGKARFIQHTQTGIFKNIENPMQVGRYHSLIVKGESLNNELEVCAMCDEEVMAIKHKNLPVWGLQFHPESILTPSGQLLINNWASELRG